MAPGPRSTNTQAGSSSIWNGWAGRAAGIRCERCGCCSGGERRGSLLKQQDEKNISLQASRPDMPEYGLLDAGQGRGLLPWEWAQERLEKSHNYWVATTRPDSRPHATAVWGIWWQNAFWFSTDR